MNKFLSIIILPFFLFSCSNSKKDDGREIIKKDCEVILNALGNDNLDLLKQKLLTEDNINKEYAEKLPSEKQEYLMRYRKYLVGSIYDYVDKIKSLEKNKIDWSKSNPSRIWFNNGFKEMGENYFKFVFEENNKCYSIPIYYVKLNNKYFYKIKEDLEGGNDCPSKNEMTKEMDKLKEKNPQEYKRLKETILTY